MGGPLLVKTTRMASHTRTRFPHDIVPVRIFLWNSVTQLAGHQLKLQHLSGKLRRVTRYKFFINFPTCPNPTQFGLLLIHNETTLPWYETTNDALWKPKMAHQCFKKMAGSWNPPFLSLQNVNYLEESKN